MLIAVNIGNSSTGFGIFPDPAHGPALVVEKVPTHPARATAYYRKVLARLIKEAGAAGKDADSAIIASVVPDRNALIDDSLSFFCDKRPTHVTAKNSGLTFDVKEPSRIGADRIANAAAGINFSKGRPVAIVDFGTATTITVAGEKRTIMGGAILPGVFLMTKALHSGTAKLPLVKPRVPEGIIGKDTASAIASGVACGTAGAVEKLIIMMEKELKYKLQLVLTGGDAPFVSPFINRAFTFSPNLTFEGLRLLYLMQA